MLVRLLQRPSLGSYASTLLSLEAAQQGYNSNRMRGQHTHVHRFACVQTLHACLGIRCACWDAAFKPERCHKAAGLGCHECLTATGEQWTLVCADQTPPAMHVAEKAPLWRFAANTAALCCPDMLAGVTSVRRHHHHNQKSSMHCSQADSATARRSHRCTYIPTVGVQTVHIHQHANVYHRAAKADTENTNVTCIWPH